jgi:hypothetical protein
VKKCQAALLSEYAILIKPRKIFFVSSRKFRFSYLIYESKCWLIGYDEKLKLGNICM